ncbi:MAG: hypothetical protein QOJ85_2483 [Solirubrobacteraceae bacterium]|jgi:radical SAM superfamily enzyme YgiQ (UPF0313 family)|nr:hypothetical protein [Solirubrobacteraceae bacterium]
MRVALVSFFDSGRADEYPIAHSLGAMRLAAYLARERLDWQVRLRSIDEHTSTEAFAMALAAERFDVVGLPAYIWTRQDARHIACALGATPAAPLIVCGGPETQSMPFRDWPAGTAFVMGQGEAPLLWLCDRREADPSFTGDGLDATAGLPVFSTALPRARVLCHLRPHRDDKRLPHGLELFGERFDALTSGDPIHSDFTWYETARGCIYSCSFCGHNTLPFFATFDLDFVRHEISNLAARGIRRIFLIDPILGGKQARGKAILRLLREEAPEIRITAYLRPEFLDDEFVQLLAETNLAELLMGLQTTNRSVPKHVRGNNFGKIMRYVPDLVERGIPWRAELIVGLPGDDLDGLRESLRFTIEELRPWTVHAYHLTAIPDTQLFGLLDRTEDAYWIQADDRLRVTAANSFTESDLDRMLVYAGAVTSLYSLRSIEGKPIRRIAEVETLLDLVTSSDDAELTDLFRRLDHSRAVDRWRALVA